MAKPTTTALGRLFKKVKRYEQDRYGGCFTPTEILLLVDLGARTSQRLEWFKEYKAKGDSSPQWFYFTPSKALRSHPAWKHVIQNHVPR